MASWIMAVILNVSSGKYRCAMICLFFKDALTPPTKREVVGLNLPVLDREMDARWPPNRIWD